MLNRYKVLIVEDSESLAAIFASYLGDANYDIRISTTLDQARRDWVEFEPEIVLLDLQLPDGNGLELLSAPELNQQAVDIIVMTASALMILPQGRFAQAPQTTCPNPLMRTA